MTSPILVDAHMHVYPTKEVGAREKAGYEIWEYGPKPDVPFSRYAGDVGDAVTAMREAGFARAVLVNMFVAALAREEAAATLPPDLSPAGRTEALAAIEAGLGDRLRAFNRWACDVARTHPALTPYVAVDPWVLSPEDNAAHLRELAARGARGVKIHPVVQRFFPDDPRMDAVYRACVELDLVVLSHAGASKGPGQWAEPRAFARVLDRFPDLTLVLAHLGGGAWRQTAALARAYPTVAFDCCEIIEWTGAPHAPSLAELGALVREVGPARVMLGTDFPWYDLGPTVDRVMALPGLARDEREAILGRNALRILRLG